MLPPEILLPARFPFMDIPKSRLRTDENKKALSSRLRAKIYPERAHGIFAAASCFFLHRRLSASIINRRISNCKCSFSTVYHN